MESLAYAPIFLSVVDLLMFVLMSPGSKLGVSCSFDVQKLRPPRLFEEATGDLLNDHTDGIVSPKNLGHHQPHLRSGFDVLSVFLFRLYIYFV